MHLWMIFLVLTLTVLLADSNKLSSFETEEKVRYDGYVVYKLKISDSSKIPALNYGENRDSKLQFDIWKEYDEHSKEMHVMVHPESQQSFRQLVEKNGVELKVMIADVQKLIDREQPLRQFWSSEEDEFSFSRYHELDEIYDWLDEILQEHSDVTEEIIIGKSYEGRTIRGIKISFKANNPGVLIDSNIHAREWITSATTIWLINELLKSKDPAVRELAESVDWYIVPVLNVDGFVYSHEKDRMWRKTRQPQPGSRCIGTDPNRNFDAKWMENGGASSNGCAGTFGGEHPFSAVEIKAFADYVRSIKNKLSVSLSFHSYSQWVILPYSWTDEKPPNYNDLKAIGKAYAAGVRSLPYRTSYKVDTIKNLDPSYGLASGSSTDWAYMKMGIKLSYGIELRDRGTFGFFLPSEQIIPNSEETLAGLIEFVKEAKNLGYLTIKPQ